MSEDFQTISSLLTKSRPHEQYVAMRENFSTITWGDLTRDCASMAFALQQNNEVNSMILACHDVYHFTVAFLSAIQAGKTIILPPSLQTGSLETVRGETKAIMVNDDIVINALKKNQTKSLPIGETIEFLNTKIIFYTSGSTGTPKAVQKTLQNLEDEISMLHHHWGDSIKGGAFLSSVTHFHAYGLPLHVLWALCSGEILILEKINYPEFLEKYLAKFNNLNFISSPVFLNKYAEVKQDFKEYKKLKFVCSAGSPLPESTSIQLSTLLPSPVVEIYGSTESGALATRNRAATNIWTCMKDVRLEITAHNMSKAFARHISDRAGLELSDEIEILEKERFLLKSRKDNIVKIHEKRVSLTEMEALCKSSGYVQDIKLILLEQSGRLGAVVVPSSQGQRVLEENGRRELSDAIRNYLRSYFDLVVLPRKWRFVAELPCNDMGKVQSIDLKAMFATKE